MIKEYGIKVPVGKGKLNVYTEGNGDIAIVILSGAGVSSPVLEYRPLYRKLSDKYKIAVVEKSGYGFSESTETERTVENMVDESRKALIGAGIKSPYILMPHSYSGFEAIYWANTYPDEVTAILSIDMGIPETAVEMGKIMTPDKIEKNIEKMKKMYSIIKKRGIAAKIFRNKLVNASGLMTSDYLSENEKKIYEDLFYKNLGNIEIFQENKLLVRNGMTAGKTGKLKAPAFFYISNMKVPLKQGSWRDFAIQYAQSVNAQYRLTDKGHFMYSVIPDEMSGEFKKFLAKILQ